jgi:N-carbamoylputrescine amidase
MVKIAGAQFQGNIDKEANIKTAMELIREAASKGANIICLQELFNTIYFCFEANREYIQLAEPIPGPTIDRMSELARETRTVLICPIFEKEMVGEYYNSAVVVGPNGEIIGKYRKNSIPLISNTPGERRANEKLYFKPGNLGFPVFSTPFGVNIGIMICYDRHFPEHARILGLNGADVVFVPTATPAGFTRYVWEIELKAHAVANIYYVCGVNKVGRDVGGFDRTWYGTSIIVNPKGEILAQASETENDIIYTDLDLSLIEEIRNTWNFYRDRRPDAYGELVK